MKLFVVCVAGGASRRYGARNKLLEPLAGIPVFLHSLRNFRSVVAPEQMVLVVPQDSETLFRDALAGCEMLRWLRIVHGGACRSESVRNGIAALHGNRGIVAIHDAARPLASGALLRAMADEVERTGIGCVPGKMVVDSLKSLSQDQRIQSPVDRSTLCAVETPQVFVLEEFEAALAKLPGADYTDDAELMRQAGYPVTLFLNAQNNLKITRTADLPLLEYLYSFDQNKENQ